MKEHKVIAFQRPDGVENPLTAHDPPAAFHSATIITNHEPRAAAFMPTPRTTFLLFVVRCSLFVLRATSHVPRTTLLFLILAAMAPLNATAAFKNTLYYPYVEMGVQGGIDITFLFNGRKDKTSCETLVANVTNSMLAVCPTCQIKVKQCLDSLEPQHRKLLSAEPLDIPSARLPDGVSTYHALNPDDALTACRESEKLTASRAEAGRIVCYPPKTARPLPAPRKTPLDSDHYFLGLLFLVLSGLASGFACYLIIRYDHLHAHLSHDRDTTGPQKFHATPVPRIGGVAILIGLLVAGVGLLPVQQRFSIEEFGYLLLAGLPAFAGGMAEDLTEKVSVLTRLALTMLAALLGAWLMGAVLERIDVPGLDTLLRWSPFAIAFTVFAVGGVANSINIVDGYNGLAGGYAVLVLAALAWVAAQVGDAFLMTSALAIIGALISFLIWNYPKGKIFLGDGGAYLLGFWLAELSVLLVVRHPEVSPWFPMLMLAYPVFETLFSIYRRTFRRGDSPGHPDALHLHQLIYTRLARVFVGSRDPTLITRRNSMVAGYIWAMSACCVVPAIFLWNETDWLIVFTVVFCATYVWVYRRIIGWRTPVWLIRSRSKSPPHALPLGRGK